MITVEEDANPIQSVWDLIWITTEMNVKVLPKTRKIIYSIYDRVVVYHSLKPFVLKVSFLNYIYIYIYRDKRITRQNNNIVIPSL